MHILIRRKTYDCDRNAAKDSDDILPGDRQLSAAQEPEAGFARKRFVQYSFIKRVARPLGSAPPNMNKPPIGNPGKQEVNATAAFVVAEDLQTQKYLTLLELSKAIASHRELSALFDDLACRLRNLFSFRDLAVMMHDDRKNVMRSYIMEGCEGGAWLPQDPTEVPIESSINGYVWQQQEPLVVRDLDNDHRFASAQILRDRGVKSVCCLPLSTVHQQLGTLNLWSEDVGAYDHFDLGFAQLVAGQIAVAVEAQFHQQQLARERDRSKLLLEVNNTLVSNLNLRELLSAISHSLVPVMPHEAAALALYDKTLNQLRVAAFDFPEHEGTCVTGKVIPFENNAIGEAFTTRKTVLIDYQSVDYAKLDCGGMASGCAAPLILRDRVLGVIGIKSKRPNAFSEEDAELFGQVANQMAIAVENALAYNEIEALKNKLEKEDFPYMKGWMEGVVMARAIELAIEKNGGKVPQDLQAFRKSIRDQLEGLKDFDVGGIVPSVSYANHQGTTRARIAEIKGGKFVPIGEWLDGQ